MSEPVNSTPFIKASSQDQYGKNLLNLGQEKLLVSIHKKIKLKMVGVGDIK